MDRNEIAHLLYNSDVDSGSSSAEFDEDISEPNRVDDEDGNLDQNIYENTHTSYIENDDGMTGNNWTENFNEPHMNAHITFNSHNLPVGINPDLIETLSLASPSTFFPCFLMKKLTCL